MAFSIGVENSFPASFKLPNIPPLFSKPQLTYFLGQSARGNDHGLMFGRRVVGRACNLFWRSLCSGRVLGRGDFLSKYRAGGASQMYLTGTAG